MADAKRFRNRIVGCPGCGEPRDELLEHPEGDWVQWSDYDRLRSVALAARALVQSAHASLADDDIEIDETAVSEPALTALESALEAAGYGMSDEEAADG